MMNLSMMKEIAESAELGLRMGDAMPAETVAVALAIIQGVETHCGDAATPLLSYRLRCVQEELELLATMLEGFE